jgi:ATP-binding cassette, subfamily F, member 3
MYLMSGGQKSRVSFAMITWERPHVLMLDEPTNHLDYDAINALIMGLNDYSGGLVIVSHDEYFLNALVDKLYLVDEGKCLPFKGDL